jgi:TetR/AcrR family transcriptional repressor of nem operon
MANSTKEHILDAATRLIHLRGFHNTSIDDILRESGVGKGNFYYYFKSKDELGFATLERAVTQIRDQLIGRAFVPGRDPWAQLEAFLELVVSQAERTRCEGGCPLGNLAVEMSDIHEEFRCRLRRAFDEVRGRIEAALRQAQAEGSLRAETDVPRLVHFILAAFEGACMLGKLHKDPGVMAGVIEELKQSLARYRVAEVAARPHT